MMTRHTSVRSAPFAVLCGLAASAFAQCPPASPGNLSASHATACNSIYVDWADVSGASEYFVYRGTTSIYGDSVLVGTALFGASHLTDVTALAGRSYYYWVTAKRNLCVPGSGTSSPSGPVSGWRDQDPMAPTDVRASDGTVCAGVLVTWNQSAPTYGGVPTGHTIFRNTINLYLTSSEIGTAAGSWGGYFLDTSPQPGTPYYYWGRGDREGVTLQSSYAYIGHFSRFIRPGAVRVLCAPTHDDLECTAFHNPDGRVAMVVMNRSDQALPFQLLAGGRCADCDAPAHSISTFMF